MAITNTIRKVTFQRVNSRKKFVKFVHSVKSYYLLKMSENKKEIRYILKFYYKKEKNALQAAKKMCVYGYDTVSVRETEGMEEIERER